MLKRKQRHADLSEGPIDIADGSPPRLSVKRVSALLARR